MDDDEEDWVGNIRLLLLFDGWRRRDFDEVGMPENEDDVIGEECLFKDDDDDFSFSFSLSNLGPRRIADNALPTI